MSVSRHLTRAWAEATTAHRTTLDIWIKISAQFGDAALMVNIQREMYTDAILRTMEDEVSSNTMDSNILTPTIQFSLSSYWIGGIYEIFRILRERGALTHIKDGDKIFYDLELIRMPLEKLQIAKDEKILKEPIRMKRLPELPGDTDVIYDAKDPFRSHIMPTRLSSATGSAMWHVIDLRNDSTSFWLERREISDRIVKIMGSAKATAE